MTLDHAWIHAHIPHHGSMCLLDRIDHWTSDSITCTTRSHADPSNPLCQTDGLGPCIGIEYAAQAMALHGALLDAASQSGARQGYLASVREVNWSVPRLDASVGTLTVRAQRVSGQERHVLYEFRLEADARCWMTGRATVILDAVSP